MEYKVGQILYFVGTESARVIPVRVVEEVVRTTIDGTEKTYTVELPDEKRTHVSIVKMKGTPYISLKDVNELMVENAKEAIQKMIDSARALTKEAFQVADAEVEPDNGLDIEDGKQDAHENADSDVVSVDIGNGVMAKMNVNDLNKVGV